LKFTVIKLKLSGYFATNSLRIPLINCVLPQPAIPITSDGCLMKIKLLINSDVARVSMVGTKTLPILLEAGSYSVVTNLLLHSPNLDVSPL